MGICSEEARNHTHYGKYPSSLDEKEIQAAAIITWALQRPFAVALATATR
jgi:hypothetical protein